MNLKACLIAVSFWVGLSFQALAQPAAPGPGALTVIPFAGTIDLKQASIDVKVGRPEGTRQFVLNGEMTGRGMYHLKMDVSHVPLPYLDVAAVVEGDLKITGDDPRTQEFAGNFKSSYMLLNYAPFHDASIRFAVRDRKFLIESMQVGGVLGSGEVQLTGKRQMNLNVDVVSADIEEVSAIIRAVRGTTGPDPLGFTGMMKGAFNVNGTLPRPYVQGRLAAFNGRVKSLDFDTISTDFDGQFPQINLKEVLITQAEGLSFRLSGALDVSDWAGLPAQVRLLKKSPTVTADDKRREWVFKRMQTSDDMRTEFKYFFTKDDRGDTEAVLGIQKSIGF
ncbi:MAG: hypothetical protein HQL22_07725 [Candidatus Omnitrophica bacterium]|nr:hypothetical protein [Candidatus Omnitrophota bacterium]